MNGMGMGMSGWAGGWGMWLSMALWWLVPIAAIVLVVVWIGFRRRAESSSSAEEILKQRYARGEIDRAEYEQRRHDLRI